MRSQSWNQSIQMGGQVLGVVIAVAAVSAGPVRAADGDDRVTEEIVVTGSYVARPTQALRSSPIQVIDSLEIERSGFVGVDDLLKLNTANIGSIGGAQDLAAGGADNRATRSANLRGLGNQSTLVLMNGRRLASTDGYTNLVAMTPTIAVQRVETVLDGASALYGSDAIAGVINVITDKDFEGVKVSGQYTDLEDAPRYAVQGMVGGGDRFHGVVSASYEYQDKLQGYERSVTDFDNTSGLSQPGNFILNERPTAPGGGDVIVDNGVDGPVNYSEFYDQLVAATGSAQVTIADPHCTVPGTGGIYAGDASAFPDPAGRCRFSYQQRNPVIPRTEVTLLHGDFSYEVTPEQELYFEGRYYHQETKRFGIASLPIIQGTLTVPAANPYNPFGVDAEFSGRVLGSQSRDKVEQATVNGYHVVAGGRGSLPFGNSWSYDASAVYSSEDLNYESGDTDLVAAQNAFDGFGGVDCQIQPNGEPSPAETAGQGNCVWFSPFGTDQQNHDPQVFYNLETPALSLTENDIKYLEAVATGDLWQLPGGTVGMAVGTQVREESASTDFDSGQINNRFGFIPRGFPGEGDRTIKSVFTELYLPIVERLDAQLAVRYEDYGGFTTTDPKLGINWRPVPSLSLRGSVSTAFRAPDINETVSDSVESATGQTVDPLDPSDTGTFRVIRTISNPDLEPEESTNYNLGVTYEPVDSLSISVDYWNFDFTNQIALEAAQQVINADPTGPAVQRDQFGRLLSVDRTYFNSGSTQTDGIDFRLDYTAYVGEHEFTVNNLLTYILTYEVQLGQGQPVIDALGGRNATNPGAPAPEFRNNLRLSWRHANQLANVFVRHTDSVTDDLSSGEVDSWTVVDVQYSYRFGATGGYEVTVGALNLLDEEPPTAAFTGYLPSLADALGRQAYLRLTAWFE